MTRATLSHAILGAMVLLGAACDSSDNGPPVPIDDFARALADAHCNNIGPCCEQAGFPHDPVQCHTAAEAEMRAEIERSRANPNLSYDGNAARGCVNAYTAMVQACQDEDQIGAACRYIFVGTLQPGQPCTSSSECAPGNTCALGGDGGATRQCTGTTTRERGKLGDGCRSTCTETGNSTSCSTSSGQGSNPGTATCFTNDGLFCDSTFHCAVQPALGQTCTNNTPCAGEAFCDNGTCAAKRTTGPCGQSNNGCAATAYCDTATGQCTARKSTGATCATSSECSTTDRCTGGTCRKRSLASASACMGNL